MTPELCGSAPEQVDRLKVLWERLPQSRRDEIAFRWVDHSIRKGLVIAYQRIGHKEHAGLIEVLPPIIDDATLLRAEAVLKMIARPTVPELPIETITCVISALTFVTDLLRRFEIYQAGFMMVMTSRLVFGDDRLVKEMEKDLGAAAP